ncbi:MAG: hypothetical protein Q4F95_08910 [Oscillospiraceae bacterium]|nr:hypothetical protein [Oscillospiraceae bacterium]
MADTERIFLNHAEIKNCAQQIGSYNEKIKDQLDDFATQISKVQSWDAMGASEMRDNFNALKPDFAKFYEYLSKVVKFINQNVSDDAITLDTSIKNNAMPLKKRI